MAAVKDLYEFLVDAELHQYYNNFKNDLKVTTVPQIKYVEDEDLQEMGMTKPEIRRLKKFFRKECPQGALGKIKKILHKPGLEVPHQGSPPSPKSPAHRMASSKHIIPQDAIMVCKTLGTGEFGTVQQGIWTNEEGERVQVAIKCLSKEKMQTGIADFLKEATIMHSLDHEHIVQLYGAVFDRESYMLVTELAPLRSLLECLKEPRLRASFSVLVLCNFAVQIADGMAYLEGKRLIHRDLAARNVLVFAKDKVKISDFGLSRALGVGKDYYQTNFNVNLKLPIAWCAPECIHYLKFTSASDVWAYGVTLWELFSYGFQPWAAFTGQQILDAIDEPNCQRLEHPDCCPRQHYELMLKCWDIDDKKRPTFSEILRILPQIKPDQVQAASESANDQNDFLVYNKHDIITVLDKRPADAPTVGVWKGITENGKTGYFDAANTAPYFEIKTASSPLIRKVKITRKESGRKSMKASKKLHAGLISRPQNDLRHTGHIGYDGAMFGDVAFIGDNYDKLPVKVVTPYKPHEDMEGSSSLQWPQDELDKPIGFSNSVSSLASSSALSSTTGMTSSMISETSTTSMASSQDTLTDVSSFQGDTDSLIHVRNGRASPPKYEDVDDTDLDSFRFPDISSSLSLDFGPSFMDEVMKALNDSGDSKKSGSNSEDTDTLLNDRSPLIDSDSSPLLGLGQTSFDNVAMASTSDIDSNESASRTMSSTDLDHPVELDSSFSSREMLELRESQHSSHEDDLDKKKSFKPKLKIMIPSRDSSKPEPRKQAKVKPMSAADERKIDEAIAMANEFASLSRREKSPSPSPVEGKGSSSASDTSPSLRSMFGLKKKDKSPKPEKKTFTEEIAKVADLNEDVTPEAQEAYNMLVVRGSVRDRSSERKQRDRSGDRGERSKQSRERRMRRSLEHQRQSVTPERPISSKNGRNLNQNIRSPQGIPGRRPPSLTPDESEVSEMDTNPLRRLRDSQRAFTRPRPPAAPPSDGDSPGKQEVANGHASKLDHIRRPNLMPQSHLGSKYRESDSDSSSPIQVCVAEPQLQVTATSSSEDVSPSGSVNPIPLPPRRPMRPSTIGVAPKGRKYPLDMSKDYSTENRYSYPDDLPPPPPSPPRSDNEQDHDSTRDSEDSVFSSESGSVPDPSASQKRFSLSMFTSNSLYSVKGVKCTAAEMGINNNTDSFWQKEVNLDDLQTNLEELEEDMVDDISPMFGRYKTSDNVSYEDLLDFALDGPEKRAKEKRQTDRSSHLSMSSSLGSVDQGRDEIRLMRRVLTKQEKFQILTQVLRFFYHYSNANVKFLRVTVEDCLMALEETNWDVHNAIKYVKLKQLLATQLGDLNYCKEALLRCRWNVQEAANYMLANPPGQESPECVDV